MEYIKLFETHTQYEEFAGGGMLKPNVSHCVQENEVHYNPRTWADEYFTTVARENGAISFNIWKNMGTDMIKSISYSTDNGETWARINNTDNKTANLAIDVTVNNGDKVMWKGDAAQLGFLDEDECVGSFFSSTCEFDVQGNIMSLLYRDGFKDKTTIENEYEFACLFFVYDEEKACNVVNAKNLSLPATTLASNCYSSMFANCTSLTTAPSVLPATRLETQCYYSMFEGCTGLATAPELPATALANYCYESMFYGCTNLAKAPELSSTTLAACCYHHMFEGCTSLTTAPVLPAETLASSCYSNMFNGCTSLTTAPELPATILAEGCYLNMFYNCIKLATAPALPATTLASNCYRGMFGGCTSLTTAPELPAATLTSYCYQGMFGDCSSLNYIKAMFTTTPSTTYTRDWVSGVASTGTFVKNTAATWNVTGVNGIPTGWTVETATA